MHIQALQRTVQQHLVIILGHIATIMAYGYMKARGKFGGSSRLLIVLVVMEKQGRKLIVLVQMRTRHHQAYPASQAMVRRQRGA